jgi:hypothetical protein
MWYLLSIIVILFLVLKTYDFLDGRNLLKDVWSEYQLSRLTIKQCEAFCENNSEKSDIIICLTTIPSRLPFIETTLKSLFMQSRRPKSIRLHLPHFSNREKCEYDIPLNFLHLKNLEIIRCDDFGPATKLIPALDQVDGSQKLLILDDDMIYPKGLINHFHRVSCANSDQAIGGSGWVVPENLICDFVTLWKNIRQIPPMPYKSTRIKKAVAIDILQGYSGYLVQPRFFNLKQLLQYGDAPKAAYYVDDVWISAHCNVPKYIYPYDRFCFHPKLLKKHFVSSSLALYNRGNEDPEQRNNTIMIRHFKDRWLTDFM